MRVCVCVFVCVCACARARAFDLVACSKFNNVSAAVSCIEWRNAGNKETTVILGLVSEGHC